MNVSEIIISRKSIKKEIRRCYKQKKNAIELAKKYQELTNLLNAEGVNVRAKLDFLTPEFWENYPDCFNGHEYVQFRSKQQAQAYKKSKEEAAKKSKPQEVKIINESEKSYYILSLAGSFQSKPKAFDDMGAYITAIGLVKVDEDVNDYAGVTECIYRYEFFGTEQEFKIITLCTRQTCCIVGKGFEMEVYGSKRNY